MIIIFLSGNMLSSNSSRTASIAKLFIKKEMGILKRKKNPSATTGSVAKTNNIYIFNIVMLKSLYMQS